eukprot:CAMPEP_0172512202 /NCGR_PEP_ID=MMETSP1066-20121228/242419_1 /TAXON_ID=671091 /ORGANISM="Coscinodiscus wailesii, Strain CCMP2513" /LENGTH=505 /DNA_ID=CAMNT_0013291899 /DNA_START=158 /DNA_END=1672 /DNA_ORIENTATION=+
MNSNQLTASPVSSAFFGIQWDPLDKLRLSKDEKLLLRSAEANPIDYTLTDGPHSASYARVLLKVLAEASGPSGPSSKVSHLKDALGDAEALQMLYTDPMGVVTHYAISKLYEVVICVGEKQGRVGVSIASTFYMEDGFLLDEWRPLLRVLHLGGSGDPFAQRGAALCLAHILMAGCPSQRRSKTQKIDYSSAEEPLQALVSWITSQLQSSASTSLTMVTPALTTLMSCSEARLIFASSGGIGYLSRHLRSKQKTTGRKSKDSGATVQQLYELSFCLWTMTYECNTSSQVRASFARDGAVAALVELVSTAPREKVVRVALSALRNLAICSAEATPSPGKKQIDASVFLTDMIGCGLMKQIDHMKARQWTDPDIIDDVTTLHGLLHENYKDLSRWDVYQSEVESGQLSWGVLHTEKFFQENAMKLEGPDADFRIVKILIALVSSEDEEIASIACFDIGEFVRYYPNGRAIAKRLGAKDLVMKLIDHDNKDLQRHALQCVSKIMVNNW